MIASTLTYLDNGFVFVGSHYGDSQIICLSKTRLADGCFVEIIDTFKSLAPIVDFSVVDLESIGQSSLIACSGAYKEGSLRVIRKGSNVQVDAMAYIELTVKDVFAIGSNILCLSSPFMTFIFQLNGEELAELSAYQKITCNETSILICSLDHETVLQVTPKQVICMGESQNYLWNAPAGVSIHHAAFMNGILAFATSNRKCYIQRGTPFNADPMEVSLPGEVSSLCLLSNGITPFVILSLWHDSSTLFFIRDGFISSIAGISMLDEKLLVRSMIVHELDDRHYLFVGMGNGILNYYELAIDPIGGGITATCSSRAIIGNEPVRLQVCKVKNQHLLIAFAHRPFLITSVRKRVSISLINLKDVRAICGVTEREELFVAKDDGLYICQLDGGKQGSSLLNHQTHKMNDTCTRIVHLSSARAYIVLSFDHQPLDFIYMEERQSSSRVHLIDQNTFSCIALLAYLLLLIFVGRFG